MTDKDVTIVPVPFPAMQEALRAGEIDVGEFPQPFAALLEKQAKVRKLRCPTTSTEARSNTSCSNSATS
jgi:ABC-type nitrate/sulfonate/bicarbonate transport system substrate-binding protein